MKKIVILLSMVLLITGCGLSYTIAKQKVSLNESVDFRHIHYQTSTVFDYGSDKNYRSYSLYDKKPHVIYSFVVNRVEGTMNDDIEKLTKENSAKKYQKKIHGIDWVILEYKDDEWKHHMYFSSYDKNEYYRIDFHHAEEGKDFEKQFMNTITIE